MKLTQIFKKWLAQQPRWVSFVARKSKAQTLKNKLSAYIHLINGIANITFPFKVRHHKTGQWLRWEEAYNEVVREAEKLYPDGQDSFKEPKIFWWRQFIHTLGGFFVGASNLVIGALCWTYIIILWPIWLMGGTWASEAAANAMKVWIYSPYVITLAITLGIAYKEFKYDISRNPYKNYLDVLFWCLGSGAWILIMN